MTKKKKSILSDQRFIVLLVIIVLCAIFSGLSKEFRQYTTILSMLDFSYYDLLMAIGVTFPLITGGVDLSIGTGMVAYALIAGTLINVAGVSEYLKEAYITYSDEAKEKLLGVDPKIIETYTVVSRETAEAMAYGGAKAAGSNICVSATGIAGPDGGSLDQPVGLVYIGCAINDEVSAKRFVFEGDRQTVRKHAVTEALCFVKEKILELDEETK